MLTLNQLGNENKASDRASRQNHRPVLGAGHTQLLISGIFLKIITTKSHKIVRIQFAFELA